MAISPKRRRTGRNILIGLGIFLVLGAIGFHIFITRYLPPIVQKRLREVIVNGSDSLYKFEMGKFDLSFWGGSAQFEDLKITIDSNVYRRMMALNTLPPLTTELLLRKGHLNGMGLQALIFSKKIDIREIVFDSADVQLARHFIDSKEKVEESQPLYKLIQPRIKSIHVGNIYCADLKINYRNVDSAAAFRWQIEKSNILITDVRVDSVATYDTTRLLYAKNIFFNAHEVKLKTTDGLYYMQAGDVAYTSADRIMEIKGFDFTPAVSDQQLIRHFGYQHEVYRLKIPVIKLKNFLLPRWITHNRLEADVVELSSPTIAVSMDRHARPNPNSKKGGYPHQLLQRAGFLINIGRIRAIDGAMTYTETNDKTNLTGKLVFPTLSGTIDNITNDPLIIQRRPECVADVQGSLMETGRIRAVFRFKLADRKGGFAIKSTITNLNAPQLKTLFKAMTAVEVQSFNMQRLDYEMTGNEDVSTGSLSMRYDNMDILINQVEPDKSLDKKGFLSFLANRLIIYKENPMKDEEERKASGVVVQRDATRSFFNLVWKNMFTAAGQVVLRPMAIRRMDRKAARAERREERKQRREERRKERNL